MEEGFSDFLSACARYIGPQEADWSNVLATHEESKG